MRIGYLVMAWIQISSANALAYNLNPRSEAKRVLTGVPHVIDRLHVGSNKGEADIAFQSRIISKINLDPAIGPPDLITVDVNSGEVDIGGIVDTWVQHRQVTHDAFLAGAKIVVNHLRVREDPSQSEQRFVYRRDPFSIKG